MINIYQLDSCSTDRSYKPKQAGEVTLKSNVCQYKLESETNTICDMEKSILNPYKDKHG